MRKIDDVIKVNFDLAALNHFNKLNPVDLKGGYKKTSIIFKLQNLRRFTGDPLEVKFLDFLLGLNGQGVKEIITGRPDQLFKILGQFKSNFPLKLLSTITPKNTVIQSLFGKKVYQIFNYGNYRNSRNCLHNLSLFNLEQSIPCFYCNNDGIEIVKNKALLNLDHFYPKNRYPFLALSFFNLIPCCSKCNTNYKGDKEFCISTHVNPFDKSFDDLFKFKLKNTLLFNCTKESPQFTYLGSTFPDYILNDLDIINRYQTKSDLVYQKLSYLKKNPVKKLNLHSRLGLINPEKELFKSAEIPTSKDEICKYSLGKLKFDICKDLGIL